ncbi:hypothetical protein Hs30E_16280 [Lactococcus hodotermopsidis]|uniref:Transposase DDE domain-containing protein n=1 Tax=Pseudolactococcus hodotermopsidis TaxID=2709157 RepID=A0A6A0BH13_9LACT|nr:transposase [Lactococcus hodotermopsidis]GFH43077.1 hypothetical protein Hs30E_16280 [Lactococcus hodotermopsidis]
MAGRTCVCSFRQDDTELLFNQTFIVTNLPDCFSAKGVVSCYKLRGTMKNFIKEIKNGFSFDKMSSSNFVKNQARMMLSNIAYNLMYLMKQTVMPKSLKEATITTIRERVFKIATRITKHNWKFQIHFGLVSENRHEIY